MYAAGSSSSDDADSNNHPQLSFRRKQRTNGILKCFILTPTAHYVNPMFAHILSSSDPVPYNDDSTTVVRDATTSLDGGWNPIQRSPLHSYAVSLPDAMHSLETSPTSFMRSPSSTLSSFSSSPPSFLLKRGLLPTPSPSTSAQAGPSTLAQSPGTNTVSSAMYHSLFHPSPTISHSAESYSSMSSPPGSCGYSVASILNKPDTTLGGLAKRFVDLICTSPQGTIDMKGASVSLGVHKRRIYDITNVLEGIGLITKNGKKCYEWLDSTDASGTDRNLTSNADELRRQVNEMSSQERQIDEYLDYLYHNSLHFSSPSERARKGSSRPPTGHKPIDPANLPSGMDAGDALKHMYIRYSDVTGLLSFYGSDAIVGIKAPVGTNLEVPDPDQGMQVGKRRYQMFLSSKLPEGSFVPGAKDNRGPIRVYLVRPEVTSDIGGSGAHISSRPAQVWQEAKPGAPTAPKKGSYVEPEPSSTHQSVNPRAEQSPGALDMARKRPYAEVPQPGAYPYLPPHYGPSPPQYYYHYPADASVQRAPYYPMYYPPLPPPPAFASEVITPDDDSKPPATTPKRKRTSEPAPRAPSRTERQENPGASCYHPSASSLTGFGQEHFSPIPPLPHPRDSLRRQAATSHPCSPAPGLLSPQWQRSGPDRRPAGTPGREPRHRPLSPCVSPAALVDQSELFAMPLQSPAGPPRGSSILLSPGASAPPGFSPHRAGGAAAPPPPYLPAVPPLSLETPPRGSGGGGVAAPAKRPHKRRPRT